MIHVRVSHFEATRVRLVELPEGARRRDLVVIRHDHTFEGVLPVVHVFRTVGAECEGETHAVLRIGRDGVAPVGRERRRFG
jgi:hypothetical protein